MNNTILFVGEHPKSFDVRWHTHDAWELVYCTSGQGAFRFENGTVLPYRVGEMVAIPPLEVHANSSREGFTNIHLTIADPSFPYKTPFRVADDDTGSLHSAFTQAKTYYMTDIRGRELVLEALGALITSYIVVFRSSAAFSLCARPAAQTHPYGHSLFLPWLSFWDSLCRGIAAYARTQKKSRPPAALAVIRHSGQRNFPKCAVRLGARHSAAPGGTACRRWGATRAQASAHGNFPGKRAGESPSAPC